MIFFCIANFGHKLAKAIILLFGFAIFATNLFPVEKFNLTMIIKRELFAVGFVPIATPGLVG